MRGLFLCHSLIISKWSWGINSHNLHNLHNFPPTIGFKTMHFWFSTFRFFPKYFRLYTFYVYVWALLAVSLSIIVNCKTQNLVLCVDVYSEPLQTFKRNFLAKIVNGEKPVTISTRCFILDVSQGSKYISVLHICQKNRLTINCLSLKIAFFSIISLYLAFK